MIYDNYPEYLDLLEQSWLNKTKEIQAEYALNQPQQMNLSNLSYSLVLWLYRFDQCATGAKHRPEDGDSWLAVARLWLFRKRRFQANLAFGGSRLSTATCLRDRLRKPRRYGGRTSRRFRPFHQADILSYYTADILPRVIRAYLIHAKKSARSASVLIAGGYCSTKSDTSTICFMVSLGFLIEIAMAIPI